MPRFAANISTMFPEVAVAERMRAARDLGFTAVEFLFPYPPIRQQRCGAGWTTRASA